jgi:hypothetical protein
VYWLAIALGAVALTLVFLIRAGELAIRGKRTLPGILAAVSGVAAVVLLVASTPPGT